MENSLKSVYKLTISIFLCIHMCVGKLALGMSNSDLEKVSLIACIGQFCSAMEIHSESVEKKISWFQNHGLFYHILNQATANLLQIYERNYRILKYILRNLSHFCER